MATRTSVSAGLLLFRRSMGWLEIFLAYPGGPFWKGRDLGAWTVPKGLVEEGEDPLAAAIREFEEETAIPRVLSCRWAAFDRKPASSCRPGRGRGKPILAGSKAT